MLFMRTRHWFHRSPGPWPVGTPADSLIAEDGKATRIVDARTL